MDHKNIEDEEIVERYVLGKLSPEEEKEFEEHYFSCDNCFKEVRRTEWLVNLLREQAKRGELPLDQYPERRPFFALEWLKSPTRYPAAAAVLAVLLLILSYPAWQGILTVPKLKGTIEKLSRPQANIRSFSLQQTRGIEEGQIPSIGIGAEEGVFVLNFTILEKTIPNPQYEAEILNQEGKQIWKGKDLKGVGEYEVFSVACNTSFFREGIYTLKVLEIDPENGRITNKFPFPFRIVRR